MLSDQLLRQLLELWVRSRDRVDPGDVLAVLDSLRHQDIIDDQQWKLARLEVNDRMNPSSERPCVPKG